MLERTCVVCRKADEQKKLLRFVLAVKSGEGEELKLELSADRKKTLPGRGAYCHEACSGSRKAADSIVSSLLKNRGGNKLRSKVSIEDGLLAGQKVLQKTSAKIDAKNEVNTKSPEAKPQRRKLRL